MRLENLLAKTHIEAKAAWDAGVTEKEMEPVLKLIRQAQWRWDFAAAGHGNSFHAPLETARIITNGIDKTQEARIVLQKLFAKYHVPTPIAMPDISTKAKAQAYIGLDMKTLNEEKAEFVKTVVPKWLEKAKEREAKYPKTVL